MKVKSPQNRAAGSFKLVFTVENTYGFHKFYDLLN